MLKEVWNVLGWKKRVSISGEAGFTLIEMMVVIAIIGLIAAFAMPSVIAAMTNSRIQAVENQAREIQLAMDQYYADQATPDYPPSTNFPTSDTGKYKWFFDDASSEYNGYLDRYVSLPKDVEKALFYVHAYSKGGTAQEPTYDIVLKVKNVNVENRYVHIKQDRVFTNNSATAAP